MVQVHERLEHGDAVGLRRRLDQVEFGERGHERLFAQDVLPGFGGLHRPLAVQGVGQRDVDGVDVRVGEQRLVAAVRCGDVPLLGVSLCLVQIAAGNGDQLAPLRLANRRNQRPVDPRRR